MTPEQENELVARWMGWVRQRNARLRKPYWWHRGAAVMEQFEAPPYRTDPALLWELMERLTHYGWMASGAYLGKVGCVTKSYNTLAEAVFAAAVVQAKQEGK